ncbi:MAG: SRPBCC family protein [Candidatus Eisenbacteria bacterium]
MKKLLLGLLVVIVLAVMFIATRPATYRVERSTTILAPAEVVYPLLVDFHQWEGWSPWEKLDPAMKRDFGGAPSGTGATYQWQGNSDVGEGRMTITEAEPPTRVGILLEFLKPFEATSTSVFTLTPDGEGTKVTWTMDGNHNFMAKAMTSFMSMDKMIGGDFEKGLASMKALAESATAAATPADSAAVTAP